MDFLRKTLHMKVKIDAADQQFAYPNYLQSRYSICIAYLDRLKVFFIYPKTELEQVNTLKKHIQKIRSGMKIPVVIVLDKITARQRQKLIDGGIAFVVENKQCYLPFLGVYLSERCDAEDDCPCKMTPSAQMLLLHYILNNKRIMYANEATDALCVSAMTITRSIRQLEQLSLIKTYKDGVMKVITSDYNGRELFERARKHMFNPIKEKCFLGMEKVDQSLLIAGDQALSTLSMLSPPRVNCYATGKRSMWKDYLTDELTDDMTQVELQIWVYDPQILAKDSVVDVLSLAMCYADDPDERIEESVEQMLEEYWRSRNG